MKMNELSMILDDMIQAGNAMIKAANALKDYFSTEAEETKTPASKEETPAFTKEDVRKLLVEKANADGGEYKPAVKALVKKYSSSGQLSTVVPEDYAALVAELEALGNG